MDVISPELLEILVCPETHQKLTLASAELTERLKASQAEGKLRNRAGGLPGEPIQAALVREDGAAAYLICEGIPIMLVDEAIDLGQFKP